MGEIKRKLVESGVIGRVLDDFNPRLELILGYGDTQIKIGDEVTLAEVQRPPTYFEQHRHPLDLQLLETFMIPELVAVVMTDPDALGGEYLHWYAIIGLKLTLTFVCLDHHIDSPPVQLLAYEPPRSGAHMLVLTLFKADEFELITAPNSRANFSTRNFAHFHALGPPLGASFFNIKYENEDEKHKNEGNGPSRKGEENGSASDLKEIAESSNKRRRTSLRNNNEEKNRKNNDSESSMKMRTRKGNESSTYNSAGPCRKREENGSASHMKEIAESSNKMRRISLGNNNKDENRKNNDSESSA